MEMKLGGRWSTRETGCNRRLEPQIQSNKSKTKIRLA